MISFVIVDDNSLHRAYTEELLRTEFSTSEAEIRSCPDGSSLLQAVEKGAYRPDLAILDIRMEEEDGIDLAARLNTFLPDCRIIFLTGYAEYASRAYLVRHVWFVLKEQMEDYLLPAVRRAMQKKVNPSSLTLTIRTEGKTVVLPVEEILYIDRIRKKAKIYCTFRTYSVSAPSERFLRDVERSSLVRCHQGYWVNLFHVAELDHGEFVMENGDRIPISRTFRDEARAAFFDLHRPV